MKTCMPPRAIAWLLLAAAPIALNACTGAATENASEEAAAD
ncbi:MAG: hypothetical protein ACT4N8_09685 [Sphingosinicella sp.]